MLWKRRHHNRVLLLIATTFLAIPACRQHRDEEAVTKDPRPIKDQLDASVMVGRGDSPPRSTVGMVFDRPDKNRKSPVDEAARLIAEHRDQFTQLEWIWFDGTNLSDAGFRPLAEIPSLNVISVVGTHVTATAVKEFRKQRPDCRVDHVLDRPPQGIRVTKTLLSWQNASALWQEAGSVPTHPRPHQLDVKQVYVINTTSHLHVYFRVRDTIPELLANNGHYSFYFWIDTDNDPSTGSIDKDKMRVGYDFRFEIMTNTLFATEDRPQTRRLLVRGYKIPNGEDNMGDRIGEWQDNAKDAPFGFDGDGIELAVPLELLGIESGQKIRLLIQEHHHGSSPRRYAWEAKFSKGEYTLN